MKIPINEIRPAKNPIRQTRDEEKIKSLAQSIAEKGVLQPIKVRPVPFDGTTKYEIVFGARRWEAATIAGLDEIPALVESMDEGEAIEEGLLENIQRSDMLDIHIAVAIYKRLALLISDSKQALTPLAIRKAKNLNVVTVKKRLCIIYNFELDQLHRYLLMLDDKRKPIVNEFYKADPLVKDVKTKAEFIQVAMPKEDVEIQKAVARKAAKEKLGQRRVKVVAEEVAKAETPEHKTEILESSYEDIIKNPTYIKAKSKLKRKEKKEKKKKQEGLDRAVKAYFDAIKIFNTAIEEAILAADYGKFSPEAKRFTGQRHIKVIETIQKLESILGVKND